MAGNKILVVEKDPDVARAFINYMSGEDSIPVFVAGSPEEALRLYIAHAKDIGLLITDPSVVKHGDGIELAKEIRHRDPTIKIGFYTNQAKVTAADITDPLLEGATLISRNHKVYNVLNTLLRDVFPNANVGAPHDAATSAALFTSGGKGTWGAEEKAKPNTPPDERAV